MVRCMSACAGSVLQKGRHVLAFNRDKIFWRKPVEGQAVLLSITCGYLPSIARWLHHSMFFGVLLVSVMLWLYNRKIPWSLVVALGMLGVVHALGQWEHLPSSTKRDRLCTGNSWWYTSTYPVMVVVLLSIFLVDHARDLRQQPLRTLLWSQLTMKILAVMFGFVMFISAGLLS